MAGTSYGKTGGQIGQEHASKKCGKGRCWAAIQSWLSLTFMVGALLWICAELGGPLLQCFRPPHVSQDIILNLDSFSQPAIAATLLRQEADRLFDVCAEDWDLALEARDATQSVRAAGRDGGNASSRVMEVARAIESLALLHRNASSLKADLGCKLLAICSEQGRDSDVVGYYLNLLVDAPEDANVLRWASCVLESARRCGRAPEVLASMQAVLSSHPDMGTAHGLQTVLDEHRATTETPFEVSIR